MAGSSALGVAANLWLGRRLYSAVPLTHSCFETVFQRIVSPVPFVETPGAIHSSDSLETGAQNRHKDAFTRSYVVCCSKANIKHIVLDSGLHSKSSRRTMRKRVSPSKTQKRAPKGGCFDPNFACGFFEFWKGLGVRYSTGGHPEH